MMGYLVTILVVNIRLNITSFYEFGLTMFLSHLLIQNLSVVKIVFDVRLLSHIEHHSFAAKAEDEILCAHCLSQLNISFIRLSENTVRYVVSNYLGLYFIQLKNYFKYLCSLFRQ